MYQKSNIIDYALAVFYMTKYSCDDKCAEYLTVIQRKIFILYTNTQSKFSDNIIRIISCG